MIWEKVSDYALKSGDWTIAKYLTQDNPVYGLWFRSKSLGYFETEDEAKAKAETEIAGAI